MLACSALLERAASPSRLTREGTATNLGRVPQRKSYLFVCTNSRPDGSPKGSCAARGAVQIQAALKAGLAERGMAKLQARACGASCLDTCWAGPVVAVEPAGHFYGRVTLADVPEILEGCRSHGLETDLMTTSFYLSRETLLTHGRSRMMRWRKALFAFLSRNARPATAYFRIPPGRVVEMGMQVEI